MSITSTWKLDLPVEPTPKQSAPTPGCDKLIAAMDSVAADWRRYKSAPAHFSPEASATLLVNVSRVRKPAADLLAGIETALTENPRNRSALELYAMKLRHFLLTTSPPTLESTVAMLEQQLQELHTTSNTGGSSQSRIEREAKADTLLKFIPELKAERLKHHLDLQQFLTSFLQRMVAAADSRAIEIERNELEAAMFSKINRQANDRAESFRQRQVENEQNKQIIAARQRQAKIVSAKAKKLKNVTIDVSVSKSPK